MKMLRFAILLLFAACAFAEVPEHAPDWDYKCPSGFQWSRGTAACEQADCPEGAGRTYTYECKCPEGKKCCYENGLMVSVIGADAKCPDEIAAEPEAPAMATITAAEGETECSTDGGKTFSPCGTGTVLREGDFVSTGFESRATLDFGYGKLEVGHITQLRMDEYVSEGNLNRTQMYLRVGAVQAIINRSASIRGDFSVSTPTAIASIRGSAMHVEYDDLFNVTTVNVTEDEAFVKGVSDAYETTVPENHTVRIGEDGKVSQPEPISDEDGAKNDGVPACCGGLAMLGIPLALAGMFARKGSIIKI